MRAERLPKILITGFILALLVYIVAFSLIQNRRTRNGPWRTVFVTDASGQPALLIEQPKLNISQKIVFVGQMLPQKNSQKSRVFDNPNETKAPFGEVIFQDLTFLPGTVTLNVFDHQVELLPRVLTIDKREYPWKKNEVITVPNEARLKTK